MNNRAIKARRGVNILSATTYSKLTTDLDGLPVGSVGELVNATDPTARILLLERTGASTYEVLGDIAWSNVTESVRGLIASVTTPDTVYELTAGHNLPASGTLRAWDVSAAAQVGADVGFTVATNTLTLAAGRAMVATDIVYVGDSELSISATGDVQPQAGCTVWFDSAVDAGGGWAICPFVEVPNADSLAVPSVDAQIEITKATDLASGDVAAVGLSNADTTSMWAAAWAFNTTTLLSLKVITSVVAAGVVSVVKATKAQATRAKGAVVPFNSQNGVVDAYLLAYAAVTPLTTEGTYAITVAPNPSTRGPYLLIGALGGVRIRVSSTTVSSRA